MIENHWHNIVPTILIWLLLITTNFSEIFYEPGIENLLSTLISLKKIIFIICMGDLIACMPVQHACSWTPIEGMRPSGIINDAELPREYWESNQGPLEKQPVLYNTEALYSTFNHRTCNLRKSDMQKCARREHYSKVTSSECEIYTKSGIYFWIEKNGMDNIIINMKIILDCKLFFGKENVFIFLLRPSFTCSKHQCVKSQLWVKLMRKDMKTRIRLTIPVFRNDRQVMISEY